MLHTAWKTHWLQQLQISLQHSNLSNEERLHIHTVLWKTDDNAKRQFFARTTEKWLRNQHGWVRRPKHRSKGNKKIKTCKQLYMKTLDVSQQRVLNFHKTKDVVTGMPQPISQGKHTKRKIPEADDNAVKELIGSFPRLQSPHWWASTQWDVPRKTSVPAAGRRKGMSWANQRAFSTGKISKWSLT